MKKIYQFLCISLALAFTACIEAVEKTNLDKIADDVIWGSPAFIKSNFDNVMNDAIPNAESRTYGQSDEGYSGSTVALYDEVSSQTDDLGGSGAGIDRWHYNTLRGINRFLDHAGYGGWVSPQPMTSALPEKEKNDMVGQMLVMRAYLYFDMVRVYGGVPLLLHEQLDYSNVEDLYSARAKTSECIDQIVSDLNAAIALDDFPLKQPDGHIGKAVAYALKGKVLLYYASPQFVAPQGGVKPAGTKSEADRWKEAYDACYAAYDKLKDDFELYAPNGGDRKTVMDNYYKMLVTDEMNKEMVWVRRYYPLIKGNGTSKSFTPGSAAGNSGGSCTIWEMVAAFANADGTPFVPSGWNVDYSKDDGKMFGIYTQGSKLDDNGNSAPQGMSLGPDGDPINKSVFWLNREPRFYAFLGYNGCQYPLIRTNQNIFSSDVGNDGKMQHEWMFSIGSTNNMAPFSNSFGASTNGYGQSHFLRKFVDESRDYGALDGNPLRESGVDWPIFRFAEVMLNYAEAAANYPGHDDEAYAMLDAIRKRAGIASGNNYGLGRKSGKALVADILNERKIELFLESQRFFDARRWRLFTEGLGVPISGLSGKTKINDLQRHSLQVWAKNPSTLSVASIVPKLQAILTAGGTGGIDNPPQIVGGVDVEPGRAAYFDVFYHTVMLFDTKKIQYNAKADFLRIPQAVHIAQNPTVQQTMGWTDVNGPGTFNPWE